MINQVFSFSLRQRAFVFIGTATLVITGWWAFRNLPIDAVPDITNVQVQFNARSRSLAPEELERLIAYPIEMEMGGIQGLTELRSINKLGISQVTLAFEDGMDIYRARQLAGERLQAIVEDLPSGAKPKMAPIFTGLSEIYYYTLDYAPDAPNKPANRSEQLMELRRIQDWTVKPMLRTVPGVTEVNTSGGFEKEIQVLADPEKVKNVGLSFDELAGIIEENTQNEGGNTIKRGGQQIVVRAVGRVRSLEEIARIPLKFRPSGKTLTVGDVAEVAIGGAPRTNAALKNGEEVILGSAVMLAGENSRSVSRAIHAKLGDIQTKLPPGVKITTEYNRSDVVEQTIGTVQRNLFEGSILVVAVLLAILGNWRAALIVSTAIPLSMLFAFTGMLYGGIPGSLMSLGAIDFGLIVDGAVIITECALRRMAERRRTLGKPLDLTERCRAVSAACNEVGRPMVFGVSIITIVYFPILALTGIEGKMFRPMALTVIMALVGALILAMTLIPVLCSLLLTDVSEHGDNALIRRLRKLYEPSLRWSLRHTSAVVGGSILAFAVAAAMFSRLGAEFIPKLDEGSFAMQLIRTPSINVDASVALQKQSEQVLLKEIPEIRDIFSMVGTAEVATCIMGVNIADTYVMLKPKREWPKVNGHRRTKEEVAGAIKETLAAHVPAQSVLISQPIEMRFNEILEGTRADIAVKVFGDDYDELERIASKVRDILQEIRGAADVELDAVGKTPNLEISPDREAIQRYGLHASEINDLVGIAMGGKEAGFVLEGNQRTPVVVRATEKSRQSIEDLRYLPVRTHEGGLIALGQVAHLRLTEQVETVAHEYGRRRVAILLNLRGRDVDSFFKEATEAIRAQVKMPPNTYIEWGGQFENLKRAKERLAIVVPVSLALIFFLIFCTLQNVRQTMVVFACIPLAITGGMFSMVLRGMPFSISAGIGFIALSGIAALNGLVLVNGFNRLRKEGAPLDDAVWTGSFARLRAIIITSAVASLGFVPMAISTGAGAEVQKPLATVVIGGIVSSTFLTLVLLPVLYRKVERLPWRTPVREGLASPTPTTPA
ncbi:MAG: efflux RND transporter permease subunit [Verrucomicrobiae bacterium]|nr:efflux RND transporter permease subunit [Verrucomicrobiae bacterium]